MQSNLTTLTYIELEHAQPNQHMVLLGVLDRRGATQNQPFVALVASVVPFQTKSSLFLAVFDSLVAITTHPGAQNSRSGRFRVNNGDNNNNRQTN